MKAIRNRIVATQRVKASVLLDHPSNWRVHPSRQRAALEGAVADLGQVQAVTVRRTKKGLQLVDGHLRKAVWGDQEITVNVVDLDDEETKKNLSTVWNIDQVGHSDGIHPTQKPLEIFAIPIRAHTSPGDIVYEPFSGSGSQMIAAEENNRVCYAMELAPEFVAAAVQRWERVTGKKAKRL